MFELIVGIVGAAVIGATLGYVIRIVRRKSK